MKIRESLELQAMRARELKGKKDLEGIQGNCSNFKAYKSSGMHILIFLKQEGKKLKSRQFEGLQFAHPMWNDYSQFFVTFCFLLKTL